MRIGRYRISIDLDSLILAILLNCQGINLILGAIYPEFVRLGLAFVIALSIGLFVFRWKTILSVNMIIPLILLGFYGLSYVMYGNSIAISWIELIVYVMVPFAFSGLEFKVEKIVKKSLILTSPGILFLEKVFPKTWHGGISMGVSYAFLVTITCAVLYIAIYWKKDSLNSKIIYTIFCGFNMVYFFEVLTYGSRGPAMSIIILIIALLFFRYNEESNKLESKKIGLFVFLMLIAFVIGFLGDSVFSILNEITQKFGVNIKILSKSSSLSQSNNVLNNRGALYELAISEFLKKPVLGHGFDMWDANTGLVYPHNLFLHFMYDGGIWLLCLIVTPLIKCSKRILSYGNKNDIVCWFFLFVASIPGSMFSGDIWQKYTFWTFLAFCISTNKWIRRRLLYENRNSNLPQSL